MKRSDAHSPRAELLPPNAPAPTAAIFLRPDRPHDPVFNDPRDRLPITPPPDRQTISSATVHAHTHAHPRSHARHGLARAQPSVHDARTRSAHTRTGHTHNARAHKPRARRTHTMPWRAHTPPGMNAHSVAMIVSTAMGLFPQSRWEPGCTPSPPTIGRRPAWIRAPASKPSCPRRH